MKFKTIKDATGLFVREMNAIDQGIIATLMKADVDDWQEVTMPCVGDRVYVYDEGEGEVVEINGDTYMVDFYDEVMNYHLDELEVLHYDGLPMWGTMWSFGDSIDEWWLENKNGLKLMSECGFRIYHSEKYGYFFGIDGAGYDFYEAHWIPLYKARGLKWHENDDEE